MSDQIPALTLQRPWGWAVVAGGKDVENRTWGTPYRGHLWIHNGKTEDPEAKYDWQLQDAVDRTPPQLREPIHDEAWWGALIGGVTLVDVHRADGACCSDWALVGAYHWVMRRTLVDEDD